MQAEPCLGWLEPFCSTEPEAPGSDQIPPGISLHTDSVWSEIGVEFGQGHFVACWPSRSELRLRCRRPSPSSRPGVDSRVSGLSAGAPRPQKPPGMPKRAARRDGGDAAKAKGWEPTEAWRVWARGVAFV